MSKKPLPAFLQKGGENKIAKGEMPKGSESKKLPKAKLGAGGFRKPGAK